MPGVVVIRDDCGSWAAASLAEAYAARGAQVHVVCPTAAFSTQVTTYSRLALSR